MVRYILIRLEKDKIAALISCRGGSVRLPRKNVRLAGGKPLLEWNLIAATESKLVDRVFLSTDDDEMRDLGRKYGVDLITQPWQATKQGRFNVSVVFAGLRGIKEYNYEPDCLLMMYPSSPLVEAWHLDDAIEKFRKSPMCSTIVCLHKVHKSVSHLHNIYIIDQNDMACSFMGVILPPILGQPTYYACGGGFGITSLKGVWEYDLGEVTEDMTEDELLQMDNEMYIDLSAIPMGLGWQASNMAYVMDEDDVCDINTEKDLIVADALFKMRERKRGNA